MKTNNSHKQSVLEQRLRSERPDFRAPEDFTERVMAGLPPYAISRSQNPSATSPSRPTPWLRFGLGLAAAAAIVLVLVQLLPRDAGIVSPPAIAVGPQPEREREVPAWTLPEFPVKQVEALSAKLDEPLEKELQNVISDTRQAIQFVASNFLPEK
jgi:hypothetical protein